MLTFQQSLGIAFEEDHLALTHLVRSFRHVSLSRAAVVPLAGKGSPEERRKAAIEGIGDFLLKHSITARDAFVVLSRQEVLFCAVTLPLAASENLRQVLEYELERHIPYRAHEVYFDYQVLRKGEDKIHLLVAAIRRERVDACLDLLDQVNLAPADVEVTTTALANLHCFSAGRASGRKRFAFASVGADQVEVAVVEGGRLLASRLAKRKGETLASQLESELRTLTWTETASGGAGNGLRSGVKEVRLSGCGVTAGDVPSGSGLSFALVKPESSMRGLEQVPPGERCLLLPALGAALRGIRSIVSPIHLIPAEQRRWKGKSNPLLLLALLGLNLLLVLGWGGSALLQAYWQAGDLDAQIRTLRPEVQAVEQMLKEAESREREVEVVEKFNRRDTGSLEILKEIAQILPSDVWLTNMIYQDKKIEIYGVANSASDLISLLDRSPLFKNVEFVAAITKDAAGKERFRIKAELER
ncbi:MAG: pilus assembly protein PilM [Nitrospirae bacterium]|nr:pilus assembly protein PilM [Nitrospirota bacterium]